MACVLSKKAVKAYLEKDLDSFNWLKKETKQRIEELILDLPLKPRFKTFPYIHQLVCFIIGVQVPEFLFFLDMGGGKTKLALDIISYRRRLKQIDKALVVVPNPVHIVNWEAEVATHSRLKFLGPVGSSYDKVEQLVTKEYHIAVISQMALLRMMCDQVSAKKKTKKKGKKKVSGLKLNKKKVERITELFNIVIYDEIHLAKNHSTLTFKVYDELAKASEYHYGLTGTPFGRDPQDFWAQFYLIDRGDTLGETLGMFREVFFSEHINFFGGYEYSFLKKMRRTLNRRLQHRSIRYSDTEFADLPKKQYSKIYVDFPEDTIDEYNEIVKQMILRKESLEACQSSFFDMRRATSGFLKIVNTDTGEVSYIDFPDNPKLEALGTLVENMPVTSKMVVFYIFRKTGDMLQKFLTNMKIENVKIDGTTRKTNKASLLRFQNDPVCRVLVSNVQSGGTGLNLQVANYTTYYESPSGPILRKQSEKRTHRSGQKKRTYYYDLVVKSSVDERILGFLKEGKDLFSSIVDGNFKVNDLFIERGEGNARKVKTPTESRAVHASRRTTSSRKVNATIDTTRSSSESTVSSRRGTRTHRSPRRRHSRSRIRKSA